MTPNEIEVLLHCHVSPAVHPRIDAPAVMGAIQGFIQDGLVEPTGNVYRTTPRGVAHVEQLCNLPFPEMAWVDSNGNVICSNYPELFPGTLEALDKLGRSK